jgi:hypothetical protein
MAHEKTISELAKRGIIAPAGRHALVEAPRPGTGRTKLVGSAATPQTECSRL